MNFAIIGASGNVGRKTIEILEKSKISFITLNRCFPELFISFILSTNNSILLKLNQLIQSLRT